MGKLNNILLIIVLSLFMVIPVSAKDNIVYINEKGDNLYYSSDSDYFMDHLNMLPGETYIDTLILENKSSNDYTFYLQTALKGEDTSLLEKINMVIKVDGKKVYEGNALGKEYLDNKVNENNLLKLGDIKSKGSSKVEVSTTISSIPENYSDENNQGLIDFKIYASLINEEEIKEVIKTPITSQNTYIIALVTVLIIGGLILLFISKKK